MNKNILILKKVQSSEVNSCCVFLSKNFKTKISKNFYSWRFMSNGSCSFIAKYNDQVVGHVGYTRYTLGIGSNNFYSRHSSCVDAKLRRLGIYTCLINYSFKYLSKKTNLVCTWPNKVNKKISKKIDYKKIERKYIIYNSPVLNYDTNLLKYLKKFSEISTYISNHYNYGLVLKDEKYFKWRYFSKLYFDDQNYYYFMNNSLFLFSFNKSQMQLNLLDYIGNWKSFYKNLGLISNKIKFNIWALKNSTMEKKILKLNFKNTKKKINNELIFLNKYEPNLNKFIFMSDTDSFINLS